MTNVEQIAQVCHGTNLEYCRTIGDQSQRVWEEAEEWQRQSAIKGVEFALSTPDAPASAQHDAWLADKARDGWKYGAVKDAAKKEHPCFVPYEELPVDQRLKDYPVQGSGGGIRRGRCRQVNWLRNFVCRTFHRDTYWPVCGIYRCRRCLREFPAWQKEAR